MAVAFDTATEAVRTDTSDPFTFNHTPVGTPRAVIVTAVHGTSSTDHIVGITYGGVAMTRKQRNTDTATEPGASEIWFLGAAIPTGTQTISVDLATATTDDFHFVCITLTAALNCVVVAQNGINDNVADPSVTLLYNARTCIAIAALYGGGAAPTAFTPNANCTTVHDHDLGAFYSEVIRQTTPGSVDFAIGGTSANDDVAYSAIAVSEAVIHLGAAALNGTGTLAASAAVTHPGALAVSGAGTLAAAAAVTHPGVAALTGAATVAAVAVVTHNGAIALSGNGTIAAVAAVTHAAQSALSGTGTITATGTVIGIELGASVLACTATVSAAAAVLHPGAVAFLGTGTIAATARATRPGVSALTGVASLASSAKVSHAAVVTLAGTGALSIQAVATRSGGAGLVVTATMAASSAVARPGAVALGGAATVAAVSAVARGGSAALIGSAVLAAVGTVPRLQITLKKSDGTAAANETVAYIVLGYQGGDAGHTNYGVRDNKGTATTDGNGLLTLPYAGAAQAGQLCYIAIFRPYPNPTESVIWHDTVMA